MGSVSNIRTKLAQIFGLKTPDGSNIQVSNIATYQTAYSLGQLGSEDLMPKRLVQGIVSGSGYDVVFSPRTGLVINWQTDLIDGVQTYANALGNAGVMCTVMFGNDTTGYVNSGNQPVISRTGAQINTLTFDFGTTQSGYIAF